HGGGRALRRALDGQPRLRRERRSRRGDCRRRVGSRRLPGDAAAADGQSRSAGRLASRGGRRGKAVRRDRLSFLPCEEAAAEVARLHRSRSLRHGGNAAGLRGQDADPHRPLDAALRQDAATERQGRMADSADERLETPPDRRRSGRRARQRTAGAALRRARRFPDAAAVGRRLDRSIRAQRRFPHARRSHRGARRRRALLPRRLSRARTGQARQHRRLPALARDRGAVMRAVVLVLGFVFAVAAARAADGPLRPVGDVPVMHEEADAAGIHSVYDGPWEFFVGGGGAAFDCDGSGFPSVFLAGGKNRAKLYVNISKSGGPLRFIEKPIDIDPKLLTNVIGAYPIDIDGDGHMDLFVLRVGMNLMLKGGPDCAFTLANKEWNFDGDPGWTTSFAAEWEPGQKFPTL